MSSLLTATMVCLALNVYHEARGQATIGQEAVAHVTLNRVTDNGFPNDVCAVVYQKHQFSWYWDGKSDRTKEPGAWAKAQEIAKAALRAESKDPTNGATFYHTDKVSPKWAKSFTIVATIGDHIFYKD